ncbi:MAG: DUF4248 domain-containing protein [Bacteroidaceae bacterium]|nr:DUF4248 domain-containing protein [Bacteroidaceae bacterium]
MFTPTVSKSELAMQYAPELTPKAAVNRLMSWLQRDEQTMNALRNAGYTPRQHVFTSRQVQIIYGFLGEP